MPCQSPRSAPLKAAAHSQRQTAASGFYSVETHKAGISGVRPTMRIGGDRADRALLTFPCSCKQT